jgi:glycosyltransferase involved in cell wall biosynthesis
MKNKIKVSHYVGLSGVGGVQRNFIEYYNKSVDNDKSVEHTIYSTATADKEYGFDAPIRNILHLKHFLHFIYDLCSSKAIVHIYNRLGSQKFSFLIALLPVKKLVIHERGACWNIPSSQGAVVRRLANKSTLLLANSFASKQMLIQKFFVEETKIRVIHNGVIINDLNISHNRHQNNDIFKVGYIGRLDTPKGVHILIEAFKTIDKNIDLEIVGDGVLLNDLKKQAEGMNNVKFIGRVDEPYTFLKSCHMLVVPSLREPLGNVCIEAGICSLPVVAANIDGIPEIITDAVSGELITATSPLSLSKVTSSALPHSEVVYDPISKKIKPPLEINTHELVDKIHKFRNMPDLCEKYGMQLHDKVVTYFTMERYISELHSLYFELDKE